MHQHRRSVRLFGLPVAALLVLGACSPSPEEGLSPEEARENAVIVMDQVAPRYVQLVLAVGEHDSGYVDAYYGPPEWREEIAAEALSLDAITTRAEAILSQLADVDLTVPMPQHEPGELEMLRLRHSYLTQQVQALAAYVKILGGEKMRFEAEARALYGVDVPVVPEADFEAAQADLEVILPGEGELGERLEAFRNRFVIPSDKLDAVFRAAIDECRKRTIAHLELPPGEDFTVEYVTDKPWSGYNWYKGDYKSLIQVNTDLPIYIDRAIDLACHEGYPGHHTYNALLEKNLVKDRGWVELSIYPLFSPQSLIAEGSANYGIDMAFPGEERVTFERDNLFPLAGLDPATAEEYYRVQDLLRALNYASNEAARRYLNGEINAEEAAAWLESHALSSPERAAQRVKFIDTYRSYVINYNLGQDLVKAYVESHSTSEEERWKVFGELLSTPRLPGDLQ